MLEDDDKKNTYRPQLIASARGPIKPYNNDEPIEKKKPKKKQMSRAATTMRLRKSIDDIKDDMKRRKMYKVENRSMRTRNGFNKSISSAKAFEEMLNSKDVEPEEFSTAYKIPDKFEQLYKSRPGTKAQRETELEELKAKRELESCTFVPRINKLENDERRDGSPVQEKLYKAAKDKEMKLKEKYPEIK